MAVTFGFNRQYTFYIPVCHSEADGVKNVSSYDALTWMDSIGVEKPIIIQNTSFELTVLYQEWAEDWDTGYFRGFVPNAWDTAIMSRYVDENVRAGLKDRSLNTLNYKQETYAEVTTIKMHPDQWDGKGRIVKAASPDNDYMLSVQYKMHELSATHTLNYGADDTICTSALYTHYRTVMELEHTWQVFAEVELRPQYVHALSFVQGFRCSLERLRELDAEDTVMYNEAEKFVDEYLTKLGWEGTYPPVFTEVDAPSIKEAFQIITGQVLETKVRTPSKIAALLEEMTEVEHADTLAQIVKANNPKKLTEFAQIYYECKPIINYGSPKQMQNLLYRTLGMPVRIINPLTPKEREEKKDLANAVYKFNKLARGSKSEKPLTDEEKALLIDKAATDDTAFAFALKFDATGDVEKLLNSLEILKKVTTRRSLYYSLYPNVVHWKDGRVHPNIKQSEQITGRTGATDPNIMQLAKLGDGVKVRQIVLPHVTGGAVCSIDFSGQELRLMAGQSGDRNMMACYVGDKLKDPHSITASGAMETMWGKEKVAEMIEKFGGHLDPKHEDFLYDLFITLYKDVEDDVIAKMADDHRKISKNVNFASQFDAQAKKLAEMLVIALHEAQGFLDAKSAMFPGVDEFKDAVRASLKKQGYVTTMLGRRRHLRTSILHEDKWIAEKAGRQGPNYKIQGSAAEQTKLAIGRMWDSGILFDLDIQFIGPIHDELVWSAAPGSVLPSFKAIHYAMTRPYSTLPVPVIGSCSLGPNFGQQIEVGEDVDGKAFAASIKKAVAKNPKLDIPLVLKEMEAA